MGLDDKIPITHETVVRGGIEQIQDAATREATHRALDLLLLSTIRAARSLMDDVPALEAENARLRARADCSLLPDATVRCGLCQECQRLQLKKLIEQVLALTKTLRYFEANAYDAITRITAKDAVAAVAADWGWGGMEQASPVNDVGSYLLSEPLVAAETDQDDGEVCQNCGKHEKDDPTAFDGGTPGPWCIACWDDPERRDF